jgi:hypothetical protein
MVLPKASAPASSPAIKRITKQHTTRLVQDKVGGRGWGPTALDSSSADTMPDKHNAAVDV